MRPFTVTGLLVLAASVSAAKYKPGQVCHTNGECNKNCLDSSWTVILQDGAPALVCDPAGKDVTEYYYISCTKGQTRISAAAVAATEAVCKKINGQLCKKGCVASGPRSRQEDLVSQVQKECEAAGVTGADFVPKVIQESAQRAAGCSR